MIETEKNGQYVEKNSRGIVTSSKKFKTKTQKIYLKERVVRKTNMFEMSYKKKKYRREFIK